MFLWRTDEKYPTIIIRNSPYLFFYKLSSKNIFISLHLDIKFMELIDRGVSEGRCWHSVVLQGGQNWKTWRKPPTLDR